MNKKILSMLLALAVLFAVCTMSAFAAEANDATTLKNALAGTDAEITLTSDINMGSEILVITRPVIINGGGNTLTSSATRAVNVDCEGNVTIKNLTIESGDGGTKYSNAAVERAVNVIQKPVNLTLDNVFANQYFKYTVNVAASSTGSTITMTDCEFTGYAAVNITGNGTTLTATNTDFVSVNDADAHSSNGFAAIAVGAAGDSNGPTTNVTIDITGGNISTSTDSSNPEYAVQFCDAENAKLTIKQAVISAAGDDIMLMVSGASLDNVDAAVPEAYADFLNEGTGAGAVVISDGLARPFNSVSDAVAAAADGDTVALIDDVPAGTGSIPVDKNITFDANGKDASGATLELAQGGSVATDDTVTIVSGVDGSVVNNNNGVISLQHVHEGDGWFNSDAAAHWEKCAACGENLEFLGHGDANGDGYCDTCGWIMNTPTGRQNPSTGISFFDWFLSLFK